MIGTSSATALLAAVPIAPRRAVDVFQRWGKALEQGHGAVGREHRVLPRNLLDLFHRLLDALDGRLGLPAISVASEASLELPHIPVSFCHLMLAKRQPPPICDGTK